jgi:hypothetical protein
MIGATRSSNRRAIELPSFGQRVDQVLRNCRRDVNMMEVVRSSSLEDTAIYIRARYGWLPPQTCRLIAYRLQLEAHREFINSEFREVIRSIQHDPNVQRLREVRPRLLKTYVQRVYQLPSAMAELIISGLDLFPEGSSVMAEQVSIITNEGRDFRARRTISSSISLTPLISEALKARKHKSAPAKDQIKAILHKYE